MLSDRHSAACLPRGILRATRLRAFTGSLAVLPLVFGATAARGQALQPLVAPVIEPEYNRGRNISVAEQCEPAFAPLGLQLGSLTAFPSIGLASGGTDNVYANNALKRGDAFYLIQPALRVTSDWPMHQVNILASADMQRFAHEKVRDRESYFVSSEGRLDFGSDFQVVGRVQYVRASETPFASDVSSDVSVLSQFTRVAPSLAAVYKVGRMRLTARAEAQDFSFNTIVFADGSSRDQRERDRLSKRAALQAEYALSPSIAAFMQGTVEKTEFSNPRRDFRPSRSSRGYTVLVGFNFDLAGMMRGSVAAGRTARDYTAAAYDTVGGLSMQVQSEFFLSPLTTVGAGIQRVIQDSNSPFNAAYSDTRASVTVDHALLRNMNLTANLLAVWQKVLDSAASSRAFRGTFGARYQSSRSISISGNVEYGKRRPGALPLGVAFDEISGQLGVRVRR